MEETEADQEKEKLTREREGVSLARKRDTRAETAQTNEEEVEGTDVQDPDLTIATTAETAAEEDHIQEAEVTPEAEDTDIEDHHHHTVITATEDRMTDTNQDHIQGKNPHVHLSESTMTAGTTREGAIAETSDRATVKKDIQKAQFTAEITMEKSGQDQDQLTQRELSRKTKMK